ncbi:Cullin [Apiosordaria backusii]|uniref:Cullin n=1 Tax=Apiosordaria backusii TaxID=314023 RepID=A0AA40E8F3_9PEZI|nr:Cullin [Apiosordaria backusii]
MASRNRPRPIRRPLINKEAGGFDQCWATLQSAMTDIHNKNASKLSFENLYRASYKITLVKRGEDLFNKVKEFETEWFHNHIIPGVDELVRSNLPSIALIQMSTSSSHERREAGERLLRGIRKIWEDHNTSMNLIADMLMYLERSCAETKQASVYATTIGLFRDHILRYGLKDVEGSDQPFVILDVVIAVVLDLINMDRDGDIVDRNLLRDITGMLEQLYQTDEEKEKEKLYTTIFEPRFIAASEVFYRAECEKLLRESDAGSWLRHTRRRLLEEEERCVTSVSNFTKENITAVVERELALAKMDDFLAMEGSGLKAMVDNDREEDLGILYHLIARIDKSKNTLKTNLQSRVMELGLEIEQTLKNTDFSAPTAAGASGEAEDAVEGVDKPKALSPAAQQTAAAIKWVDDVLKLKGKFDTLLENCFNNDLVIQSAITKSFADFINMFERSSEFVSLFIDDSLKRGLKGKSDEDAEIVLQKAIVLVRYLSDRDLFERYYQKHLGRRLLHGKSEMHIEKELVRRMRAELGNHFTAKFEGMFKDMELSKDLSNNYKDHIRNLGDDDKKSTELAIHVLTTNFWPTDVMGRGVLQDGEGSRADCIFPPSIKRLQESFYKFYCQDRSGRILTWVPSTGSADIKCLFPKVPGKESGPLSKDRRYEFNVSTYGMIVLMLFNNLSSGESLSFEEIQLKTNIPVSDLTKTLTSLSVPPKFRVLAKEPLAKSVKATDKFSFNAHFVSKQIKIRVPVLSSTSKVEGSEERKETERKNDQTRAHVVDAAIVRIMKQRKELTHTQLTTEVISQLFGRFKPEISLIKKRIEDLLAREYLERMEGDAPAYRYLA